MQEGAMTAVDISLLPPCRRVVLSQLAGRGRGDIGSYNAEQYAALMELLEEKPMKDGDEWLSTMMRKNKMLGVFADSQAALLVPAIDRHVCMAHSSK